MLCRLEAERDGATAAVDSASGKNDGGGGEGEKGLEFSGEKTPAPAAAAAAAAAAAEIGPPVLSTNEHEAFITTYVSEDGHHWALTLEVVPLLSAEEEAEVAAAAEREEEEEEEEEEGGNSIEGGSVSSFVSSLPTSRLTGSDDGSWQMESLEGM